MTRLRQLLLTIIISCIIVLTIVGWIAAPTIILSTGAGQSAIEVATTQVDANVRNLLAETSSVDVAYGTPDELSLTLSVERALRDRETLTTQYEDQQAGTVSWVRSVILCGAALMLSFFASLTARGRDALTVANRLLLGSERAEDLASWMYEMRAARADMTRRDRWSNRCSLPALWCHAAIRAWTEPLRAFVSQSKAHS